MDDREVSIDKKESKGSSCSLLSCCPDCGNDLVPTSGCKLCPSCGWSACS